MTKNLTFISTDRTFHFVWLPESIGKVRKCLFDPISNPLERKLFVYPLPFGNLPLSDPPTLHNFRDPPWGGYEYFLEPHIEFFFFFGGRGGGGGWRSTILNVQPECYQKIRIKAFYYGCHLTITTRILQFSGSHADWSNRLNFPLGLQHLNLKEKMK